MIYGVDPLIDRCGAVIGNQKTPVFPEKRFGWNGIDGQKLPDRPSIRVSGIFRHILFLKYDLNDSARFSWSFGSSFITYPLNNNGAAGILPVYDLIEEILLFSTAFMQVNAGSLNALMSKNIGQKTQCHHIVL